jgi:hypothetical protein
MDTSKLIKVFTYKQRHLHKYFQQGDNCHMVKVFLWDW